MTVPIRRPEACTIDQLGRWVFFGYSDDTKTFRVQQRRHNTCLYTTSATVLTAHKDPAEHCRRLGKAAV